MEKSVYIFGHKNPDTDAIVSSLALAELKKHTGEQGVNYVSCRCGHLNAQTAYILKKFGVQPPLYFSNLSPCVKYYMANDFCTVTQDKSVLYAITRLDLPHYRAIPVVDEAGKYKALLHYSEIAQNFVAILNGESEITSQIYIDEKLLRNVSVLNMADETVPCVHADDSLGKVTPLLQSSPIRRLPVVDDEQRVIGVISEHDLTRPPKVEIILVDHNEMMQAVDGVEHYKIVEVIDHHKINPMSTTSPISFINKPIGSTSTIVYTMFKEAGIEIPIDIASILLCGILSDTLILQSATTTDIDKTCVKSLARLTGLNAQKLGEEILEAGSHIAGRKATDIICQDMKEYKDHNTQYSISQIEVTSLGEVLDRKAEFMKALTDKRQGVKAAFCAILVTDITQLSSILLISSDEKFLPYITFPKLEDEVYWLKGVVSRKKQLLPLMTEILDAYARQ